MATTIYTGKGTRQLEVDVTDGIHLNAHIDKSGKMDVFTIVDDETDAEIDFWTKDIDKLIGSLRELKDEMNRRQCNENDSHKNGSG